MVLTKRSISTGSAKIIRGDDNIDIVTRHKTIMVSTYSDTIFITTFLQKEGTEGERIHSGFSYDSSKTIEFPNCFVQKKQNEIYVQTHLIGSESLTRERRLLVPWYGPRLKRVPLKKFYKRSRTRKRPNRGCNKCYKSLQTQLSCGSPQGRKVLTGGVGVRFLR